MMESKPFRILNFLAIRGITGSVLLILICCAGQAKESKKNPEPKVNTATAKKLTPPNKKAPPKLSKNDKALALIKKTISKYKKSTAIEMKVKKEVYIEMMEETKNSSGSLILSQGQLRMEIDEPDKSLLIMNDNTIWIENSLAEDFGGGVQVTKIAASKQLKKSNALIAFLFDDLEVWDKFKVVKRADVKSESEITMKPLVQDDLADVSKIQINLNKIKSEISEISYWDQLGNKTKFQFSNINFDAKVKKATFSYTPPKEAEITTL